MVEAQIIIYLKIYNCYVAELHNVARVELYHIFMCCISVLLLMPSNLTWSSPGPWFNSVDPSWEVH